MQAHLDAKSARWPGPLRAAALLLAVAALAGYVGQAGCRSAPSQPAPMNLLPATKAAPVKGVQPTEAPRQPEVYDRLVLPATKAAPVHDYLPPPPAQQQAAPR